MKNIDIFETYNCRICGITYNYSYHDITYETKICYGCRKDLIPEHIPENQYLQYLKIYILKEEIKKEGKYNEEYL